MPTLDTLQLPRIDTGAYGGREAKKIAGHLYQVEEQLRYVLGHLDEDNLSDGLKAKIESGGMGSEILQSLDAITLRVHGQDSAMSELRVSLGGISAAVQEQGGAITQLEQTAQGLASTVQANRELSEEQTAAALEQALKYTDTQLEDYPTSAEMSSAIEQRADSITSTVAAVYSTKEETTAKANAAQSAAEKTAAADAAAKAEAARDAAKGYTDDALTLYPTTAEMRSAIEQRAESITSTVEATYTTKAETKQVRENAEADVAAKADAAMEAAAADATSKANAAQAAAEKTAAADAAAKADAARDAANKDTDDKLKNYSTTVEMRSAIEQTADSITSTVQEVKKTADAASEKVTKIEQTVDGLRLEVSSEYSNDLLAGQATDPYTVTNDGGTIKGNGIHIPADKLSRLANNTVKFEITFKKVQECTSARITVWVYYKSGNKSYPLADKPDINAADDWQTKELIVQIEDEVPTDVYVFPYIPEGATGSYQFKNVHAYVSADNKTILALKSGSTELSSANITLTGIVTFQNLETAGETVINGSNIKTGVIKNYDETTVYDLEEGTIQMGKTSGTRVLITKDTIRWYVDGGPTGIFYSKVGESYIGANSTDTYYGWLPRGDMDGSYYGLKITNGGNAHFKTAKLECNGGDDKGDGTLEADHVECNTFHAKISKQRIVDTPDYGVVGMEAMESPMPVFCDNGSGILDADGACLLALHPVFLATAAVNVAPQWHVTASAPVTVHKTGLYAVVRGVPGTTFDWLCILPQKGREGTYAPAVNIPREEYIHAQDHAADDRLAAVQRKVEALDRQVLEIAQQNDFIETVFAKEAAA